MKKLIASALLLSVVAILAACSGSRSSGTPASDSSSKKEAAKKEAVLENASQDPNLTDKDDASGSVSQDNASSDPFASEKVDVDLTVSSSTMVFSEVYQMMIAPQEYAGKRVKMKGAFSVYQGPSKDSYYFAVIVADATACCTQGLEFVLEESRRYPEDYPEQGAEVTVVGEFQTYTESGRTYCHLVNAKMAP
ncbi:hypothetical protein [Suipraeoptans intestinalis]|uniref:hypothetical protein n=1 Tax=Suipraeoptans intestinalis TaxID=2606628 RepID=UPI0023F2A373|nr:hypothetical protein [Suipraeoptans intestinalis]MDD7770247.1 hypothetical protein [Suipraeoptans intestinalis]